MTDQELRLECLRLASKDAGLNTDAEFIVSKADQFYSFLRNRQLPMPNKLHTDQQEKEGHPSLDALSKKLIVFPLTPEQHALLSQLLK